MKKHIIYLACALCATTFTACDDYDIEHTAYDNDRQQNPERQTTTPPTIDDAWELQLIPDIGRQSDNIFVYKDLKYNRMFCRTQGWTGGIGGITTPLPDGSVLWAFNTSFFGCVDNTTRTRLNGNEPLNALLVQRAYGGKLGETQADLVALADYVEWQDAASEKYFWARTYLRHPNGNKTDSQIEAGEIDTNRYQYVGGASTATGKLQMLWRTFNGMTNRVNGTTITQHSLSGTMPANRYTTLLPDYYPQEGDYMYQEQLLSLYRTESVFYGQALLNADDGHTYLYAVQGTNILVARNTTADLTSPWQFYVRNATTGVMEWIDTFPTDEEMARSNIMANGYVAIMPTVFSDGGTYYMMSQAAANNTEVYLYKAATPVGPFTDQKMLFNLPSTIDKTGINTYGTLSQVCAHPELSRAGELVVSACTSVSTDADNFTYAGSADFSRPWFFRVFNWKHVYDPTGTEQ